MWGKEEAHYSTDICCFPNIAQPFEMHRQNLTSHTGTCALGCFVQQGLTLIACSRAVALFTTWLQENVQTLPDSPTERLQVGCTVITQRKEGELFL